ncbi:MAG: hypothetical protein IKU45_01990, partial [Clostridia bacterium]|nr:hypothetical protein [Clostridia bacterium]
IMIIVNEREVIAMTTTYTIYLGANPIACVDGCEAAYTCYEAAKTIAEMVGKDACLVWDETGEIIADFDPDEWGD